MKSKEISLVLSGGGARGIAHIGAIEELEERGYTINAVIGTSMGAMVGGIYALGKMEEFKNWLFTLDRLKVFRLVDLTLGKQGLIKGDRVFQAMKEFIPDKNIEDLNIPYKAIATDIIHKKEIVFEQGEIFKAIRASVAIPTVITPVSYTKEQLLVDGGVLNNIPLSHAECKDHELLVAVNVNANIEPYHPKKSKQEEEKQVSSYQKKLMEWYDYIFKHDDKNVEEKMGYFDLINNTINLMQQKYDQVILKMYPPDVLINISHESCGTFDFYKAEEMYLIGRHQAKKYLDAFEN
jgi:NTE family protein